MDVVSVPTAGLISLNEPDQVAHNDVGPSGAGPIAELRLRCIEARRG